MTTCVIGVKAPPFDETVVLLGKAGLEAAPLTGMAASGNAPLHEAKEPMSSAGTIALRSIDSS